MSIMTADQPPSSSVPWFGARKLARALMAEVQELRAQRDEMRGQLETLGILPILQLQTQRASLEREIAEQASRLEQERSAAATVVQALNAQLEEARKAIVATEDLALLQEAGIYHYRHPLTDAVAYEKELAKIDDEIKAMTRKDGGAVLATTNWTVNGSAAQGRTMVRDFSKLMLRAFNAEADNLVRGLKPYKLAAAIERLKKVADTIERLGKTMQIRISPPYYQLRVRSSSSPRISCRSKRQKKRPSAWSGSAYAKNERLSKRSNGNGRASRRSASTMPTRSRPWSRRATRLAPRDCGAS